MYMGFMYMLLLVAEGKAIEMQDDNEKETGFQFSQKVYLYYSFCDE
jgi:hypothetical protein